MKSVTTNHSDPVAEIREALKAIEKNYTLAPEHVALLALAWAALERWATVKKSLDKMEGEYMEPGRYANSSRVSPLLGQEIRLRNAVLLALKEITKLLEPS